MAKKAILSFWVPEWVQSHFKANMFLSLIFKSSDKPLSYRRSLNSLARSSKPGLPRNANMFFLYASTPGWLNGLMPFK